MHLLCVDQVALELFCDPCFVMSVPCNILGCEGYATPPPVDEGSRRATKSQSELCCGLWNGAEVLTRKE